MRAISHQRGTFGVRGAGFGIDWESQEKLDAFGEKLRPRMEAAGIQLSGQPEVFEAHFVETF